MKPLPPRTVLRLVKLWPHARKKGHDIGEIRRVGFYSEQDGLDCIWLVNDEGEYDWTADHRWVFDKFEIVNLANETDFFGKSKRRLGPRRKTKSELAVSPNPRTSGPVD
jgi:hypothetical protein